MRHYSIRTEETYVTWIKRVILFHGKRHPLEMGEDEITRFLSTLAVHGHWCSNELSKRARAT